VDKFEAAHLRESFKWTMAFGIVLAFVGVVGILAASFFTNLAVLVLGYLLLFGGALRGIDAIRGRGKTASFARVLTSVLYVIVGAMLVAQPETGVIGLTLLVTILFFAEGFSYIVMAAVAYPMKGWHWGVINGGMTCGLGVLLLMGWPDSANWAIGMLIGVNLLIGGLSITAVADKARDRLGEQFPSIVTMDGN
jgi:uncharacterized membrane protein HdeD (DUF308 family)